MISQFELDVGLLNESELFDATWYEKKYPFVPLTRMQPAEHYIRFGARLGYWPSQDFDPQKYLDYNPDVKNSGMDPLLHFIRYGVAEGRSLNQAHLLPQEAHADTYSGGENVVAHGVAIAQTPTKNQKSTRHVVLVSHDAHIGGAPNVVISLAKWFVAHTDYKVSIVCMGGGPIVGKFEAIADTIVLGGLEIDPRYHGDARRMVSEFVNGEPSFIILNSVASGGFLDVNPYDVPIFSYIHELPKILDMFLPQLELIRQKATHIFCNGVTVRENLENGYNFEAARLTSYPSFIDVARKAIAQPAHKRVLRASFGLDPNLPLVVGCGVVHWRKQPELFVKLAVEILSSGDQANFIWVGDGEDKDELIAQVAAQGLEKSIQFVGYKENFGDYLAAADVFTLTSSEDPFPLVCLEAGLLGVPSVFFKEAGATWTYATPVGLPPAGICVPIDNHDLFTQSVRHLINNLPFTRELGATAAQRVLTDHNLELSAWKLLGNIHALAGIKPRVSVVVPNYNCYNYLDDRLDSIYNQTFKDFDLYLLDDKSTDRSLDVLREWQGKFPNCSLHVAETNSGSPFIAWRRGIDLAQGELIWIAEADDYCEPKMLARLVDAFKHRGVKLAHARSQPVSSNGQSQGDYADLYLDRICAGRWQSSYVAPAQEEIDKALGRANSIPNASAVLCKLDDAKNAIQNAISLRLAGDWAFYVSVLRGGQIAYCHEVVNYHRRHATTITSSIEGSQKYFNELANTGALIRALFGKNHARDQALQIFQQSEATRFGAQHAIAEGSVEGFGYLPDLPGLLYGVGDLGVGGAQTFAARFVTAWAKAGHPCVLVIQDQSEMNPVLMDMISDGVTIVTFADIERVGLKQFVETWGIQWILTGHWWADRAIGRLMEQSGSPAKWVTVMHGCYETVIDNPDSFPGWEQDLARAQALCDGWVWTAPKNKRLFELGLVKPRRLSQIVNGFLPIEPKPTSRSAYLISDDALVFTIASRAIEEKGWLATYRVFEKLSKKWAGLVDSRLLMVGDGPAKAQIEGMLAPQSRTQLLGFVSNLAEVISISDVCVLPSWFSGESLPLTVIEFLAQGKPAIVSDIGLCAWSIQSTDKSIADDAGFVVTLDKQTGAANEFELEYQMERFYRDRGLARALQSSAQQAFKKFDFNVMMSAYIDFFR